jgi:hypothetical protein
MQVDQPGRYDVSAMYYSRSDAYRQGDGVKMNFTFKVSVGSFDDIKAGNAPAVRAVLPQVVSGVEFGWLAALQDVALCCRMACSWLQ